MFNIVIAFLLLSPHSREIKCITIHAVILLKIKKCFPTYLHTYRFLYVA